MYMDYAPFAFGFVFPSILGISRIFWGIYLPRFEVERMREEGVSQLWVHRRPRLQLAYTDYEGLWVHTYV